MPAFILDRQQILIECRFLCIKGSVQGMMAASDSGDIPSVVFGLPGSPATAQRKTNPVTVQVSRL